MHSLTHYQCPLLQHTLVTIDESGLVRHNYLKSIVYIRAHPWYHTFCRFGQMYNDMYPSLHYHAVYFYCSKNLVCFPCSSLLSTSNPWRLLIFLLSVVLPFPEWNVVEIILYIVFSDWLLALSNMHFSFIHVFSWLDSWSLFSIE